VNVRERSERFTDGEAKPSRRGFFAHVFAVSGSRLRREPEPEKGG